MLPATFHCGHCAAPMVLDKTHVRVPRWHRRWWQFGEEASEYRCSVCGKFSVLRLSVLGIVLYLLLALGMLLAWTNGLNRAGIGMAGLVTAALLFRHAMTLVADSQRRP